MDWITKLPDPVEASLQNLLDSVETHENAYMEAQNASVGQIWVSMALMNRRIQKLENMVQAQRKAMKEMNQEIDVDRHLDRDLEKSLKNY
ncbi:MAG: hypothetical protein ABEJ83_03530 [Candidatus Nanohaloarchaea archaeon]